MRPWEKYQSQASTVSGPWTKYQTQESVPRGTPQQDSVATQGIDYVRQHPFKTAFDPALKTLTGKGISERVDEKLGMKPYEAASMYGNNPIINALAIAQGTGTGITADLADMATAPINAVGGLVTKIPGVKQAGQAIAKSPIGQKIGSVLNKPLTGEKALEDKVFDLYNKTIGGTKIRNLAETSKVKADRITAVKTIQENADSFQFPDENTGEMVSRLPSNRFEQAQALRQTKINVWDEVERMSGGATNSGATIDMNVVVDKALQNTLRSIGDDAFKANPRLLRSILKEANDVRGIKTTNPTRAEEYMKSLNNELKTFRQSGQAVNYSVIDFKNNLIHTLNKATDDAIEKTLSQSGYSAQRAKYSALKSVEKEMIGAANKFLKQEAGGGGGIAHPLVDFWSLEEFMYGSGQMLMGNVSGGAKTMARGELLKTASKVSDYFRSPDRAMKKMYELAGKYKNPIVPGSKAVPVEAELMGKNIPTDVKTGIPYSKSIKRPDRLIGDVGNKDASVIPMGNKYRPDIISKPYKIKSVKERISVGKQFNNPNDAQMLNYLSEYLSPKQIASMSPEKRLQIGNMSANELRDFVSRINSHVNRSPKR